MTAEQSSKFSGWRAKDWSDLRSIWDELLPDLESASEETHRRFRGELLSSRDAGSVFERLVLEAFRLSGVTVHDPFRVTSRYGAGTMEQIDGLVEMDEWHASLIESKLWAERVDFGPIAILNHRVCQRPAGTLGLFFSAFGYTSPAIESAQFIQPLQVLLFDGKLLKAAIERENLIGLVKRKWIGAVKFGDPNAKAVDEK